MYFTGQFYLQIKVSKAILVQLLNLVGGIEIKLCWAWPGRGLGYRGWNQAEEIYFGNVGPAEP